VLVEEVQEDIGIDGDAMTRHQGEHVGHRFQEPRLCSKDSAASIAMCPHRHLPTPAGDRTSCQALRPTHAQWRGESSRGFFRERSQQSSPSSAASSTPIGITWNRSFIGRVEQAPNLEGLRDEGPP
jgi:hypothetical protein